MSNMSCQAWTCPRCYTQDHHETLDATCIHNMLTPAYRRLASFYHTVSGEANERRQVSAEDVRREVAMALNELADVLQLIKDEQS